MNWELQTDEWRIRRGTVERPSALATGRRICTQLCCHFAGVRALVFYPARSSASQASFALFALRKGDELLKYCRHSKPHICHVSLCGDDEAELQWVSKNGTLRRVRISQVKDVVEGRSSAVFKRFPKLHADELSFSLYFTEDNTNLRTLDLVCKARPFASRPLSFMRSEASAPVFAGCQPAGCLGGRPEAALHEEICFTAASFRARIPRQKRARSPCHFGR